jgi:FkbM family methyltransferase
MSNLDAVTERVRGALVHSMRACVARDRLPYGVKGLYVTGCNWLLYVLGVESDATPLKSVYGTKFAAGSGGSWLNTILRYRGTWEPGLSEFILQNVHDGDVCIDAGANCGYFSVLLAQRVGSTGKVFAVEAAPDNVRQLQANVELNGATGIIDVVMAACAPQKGELTLHVHPENDTWSRLSPPAEGQVDRRYMGETWIPVKVPADTLGSITGSDADQVSFIKMHIEGAEAAVAPGIPATFPHPGLVVALLAKEPNIDATLKPFKEAGFHIYDRNNDYRWLYERKVNPFTEATYGDFSDLGTAYVILSRQPLVLP